VDATLQQLDGSIAALRSQMGTDARFRSQTSAAREYEALPVQIGHRPGNLASY